MSTCTDTPWRVAAARTTERIAFAVRPPLPITLPMSSGATRTREQGATLVRGFGDRHGVGIVHQLPRQELHELPHASDVSSAGAGSVLGGSLGGRLFDDRVAAGSSRRSATSARGLGVAALGRRPPPRRACRQLSAGAGGASASAAAFAAAFFETFPVVGFSVRFRTRSAADGRSSTKRSQMPIFTMRLRTWLARLRADAEPVQGALLVDLDQRGVLERVVLADVLDEAAVAGSPLVGHHDAVEGPLLRAHPPQPDPRRHIVVPLVYRFVFLGAPAGIFIMPGIRLPPIMVRIILRAPSKSLSNPLTSLVVEPEPLAIRRRRDPWMIAGFRRSSGGHGQDDGLGAPQLTVVHLVRQLLHRVPATGHARAASSADPGSDRASASPGAA